MIHLQPNAGCRTSNFSEFFPQTCSDLTQSYGVDASGVYKIYPFGNSTGLLVYCDLKTAGGGWLVRTRFKNIFVTFCIREKQPITHAMYSALQTRLTKLFLPNSNLNRKENFKLAVT